MTTEHPMFTEGAFPEAVYGADPMFTEEIWPEAVKGATAMLLAYLNHTGEEKYTVAEDTERDFISWVYADADRTDRWCALRAAHAEENAMPTTDAQVIMTVIGRGAVPYVMPVSATFGERVAI